MHKQQGWPQAWEYCQAKLIQTLGRASQGVNWSWSECIKSNHAQIASWKELPSHSWNRNIFRSILPGLRRKRTGLLLSGPNKVLFSDESKSCISFWNQGPRVWRKSGGTESMYLEVQSEVSTGSDDLGCHVICWCWPTVFSEVHSQRSHLSGNVRALHASCCWQALWRCWFHFPAGLGTCPHCQRYQKLVQWPWCYCAWLPANSPDLNPIENLYGTVKRKMRDTRPNNADDLKAAIKATWASITPEQCHRLITSMPRRSDAVIHAKGGPAKYWVHRNEHTFQKPDISV